MTAPAPLHHPRRARAPVLELIGPAAAGKSTLVKALRARAATLRGPLAVIMGSEQYGLSDFWLKRADLLVRIPMAGQADSLNVAMATIITLFEAVRQRR